MHLSNSHCIVPTVVGTLVKLFPGEMYEVLGLRLFIHSRRCDYEYLQQSGKKPVGTI